MGRIGSTAKKLQTVAETAESLYRRVEELRAEVNALREGVQSTRETTERIEQQLAGQRAVLRALAAEQGVDADALIEEVMAERTDATESAAEPEAASGATTEGAATGDTAADGASTGEPTADGTTANQTGDADDTTDTSVETTSVGSEATGTNS